MEGRRGILSSANPSQKFVNSCASPSQKLANTLLDFTNDDSPSIGKDKCTGMTAESISKSLGLAWSGDFDSLKWFVAESLKLNGTWVQPGGDKKVFTAKDISITWRKNKNLLFVEGAKASQLKKEVCRYINDCSSETAGVSTEIGELKHEQLSNREAIQALSDKFEYISTVISQVRDFMGKNNEKIIQESTDQPIEHTYLHAGLHANEVYVCDANEADSNKPTNTEQSVNIVLSESSGSTIMDSNDNINSLNESSINLNQVHALNPENIRDSVIIDNLVAINKHVESDKPTYAGVAASKPALSSTNKNASKPQQKDKTINNKSEISADGFVGVERRRNRIKRIFLSGIASNVNEKHIKSYLEQRNINPTYISVFPSKQKGTVSAKVHIPSVDLPLLQHEDFWPKFVICKLWKAKETLGKTTKRKPQTKTPQGENLST